jgi:hypothetical protein
MPRKVVPLLAALVLIALPAGASAESVSVTPGTDPVAGLPSRVDYEYETGNVQENLTIVARPASGPPCAATAPIDNANVGTSGGSNYLTPTPIELPPSTRGLGSVPFTFPSAGTWRICVWLARTPDDVAAANVADANARLPHASVTVTLTQDQPKAGGSGLLAHVTGTTEAPDDVLVTAVAGTSNCPPTYDQDTDPLQFDVVPEGTNTRVSGTFDFQFSAHDLLSYRAWRVCAFVQDGVAASAAATSGSAVLDFVLKPQSLRRPKVKKQGGALVCDGGRWKARPKAKIKIVWLKGGQPIPGAKSKRLAITSAVKGKAVACRVTAANKVGKASAISRAVKA